MQNNHLILSLPEKRRVCHRTTPYCRVFCGHFRPLQQPAPAWRKKNGGNGSTSFPSARDVFLPNITGLARASCTAFHASGRRGVLICQEAGMGWYGWDVSPRVSRQSQENTSWPRCNPHTFKYCLQSLQSALGNRAPPQAPNETYYLN
jgi:hypothetical protein